MAFGNRNLRRQRDPFAFDRSGGRESAQFGADVLREKRRTEAAVEALRARSGQGFTTGGGAMQAGDVTAPAASGGITAGQGAAIAGAAGQVLQSADSSGEGVGTVAGGAASGAATGLAVGGPYGAAIGAAVGTVVGIAKIRSNKKARRARAQATKFQNIAAIKQQEGLQKQRAFQSMMSGLQAAFLGRR